MEYRRLGRTGVKVSTVSLGNWLTFGGHVDQETTNVCVKKAFELGVNLFDTADVYALGKGETAMGIALQGFRRRDFVLASKCFFPMSDVVNDGGLSRKHIFESIEVSLGLLKTPYLDLLQCHRFDPDSDLEETVRAMEDLVRLGKILYWGVSVWTGAQMREAMEIARRIGGYGPVSNQPQYNMIRRGIELDALPVAHELGMGTIVWSPLAQGLLTGKYGKDVTPDGSRAAHEREGQFIRKSLIDENFAVVERIRPIAESVGCTMAQLALAWCLRRPELTSVIVGTSRVEQVVENAAAADIKLSDDVLTALEGVLPAAG